MGILRCAEIWKMGCIGYLEALKLQEKLLAERKAGKIPDTVLSLQHPPTFTLGKRQTFHNLLVPEAELSDRGAELHLTERGGDVTFHGPGQAVLYPIVSLREIGFGARRYLETLEAAMIRLVAIHSVRARGRAVKESDPPEKDADEALEKTLETIAMEIAWQTPANPPEAKDYIFRNGRRFVRPYNFEFISHVKNRWAGKTIVDMFAEEFQGRPYEYFVSAVESGRIQVDGQRVPVTYVVRSSQKITHFLHRHEPPVIACYIPVLHEEPDILTVCKPASIPVHPCGQYRKNTVVGILQAENGLAPLFPVHRLDRLVSGLLIFARTADKADQLRQQIEGGLLHKEYIARVVGVFPEGEQVVNANVNYNAREGVSTVEAPDQSSSNPKQSAGKTATTKFTRICTNGLHSIVFCQPITGRTHQIRVHLQYIGHPIANDMIYLSKDTTIRSSRGMGADRTVMSASSISNHDHELAVGDSSSHIDFVVDPMCTHCPNLGPTGYDDLEEGMWLHCLRYSGPGWSYESPYPEWATLS